MNGYSTADPGPKVTCKDCQNRKPGCHDTCEKYKSQIKEWNEKKEWLKSSKVYTLSTKAAKHMYKKGALNTKYGV